MNRVEYLHTRESHNTVAANAFVPYLMKVIEPRSVIDVGCGLGTWLQVLKNAGSSELVGIDGIDVDKNMLAIPVEDFIVHDLREPLFLKKKFDLALCLEVGEHLPDTSSDNLVDILTNHADNILFSAALPMQGGQNHINEQPFMYWVEKFNKRGFIVEDLFREEIWNNKEIDWWYKQNMFFVKRSVEEQKPVYDFYHPERYLQIVQSNKLCLDTMVTDEQNLVTGRIPVKKAVRIFLNTIKRKLYGK